MYKIIDRLREQQNLSADELRSLLLCSDEHVIQYLYQQAAEVRRTIYGTAVYIRGLIEISNICKNDCLYCGIRRSNPSCERYRLAEEEILVCAEEGYALGFRTFVLQGGEDPYYTDERLTALIQEIKKRYPSCAVTLSLGERTYDSYQKLFAAGADRYLLRHETASQEHYRKLHPQDMSYNNRMACLRQLKEIGYQTGCGIMVGSPYQTTEHLLEDLWFIKDFSPQMCGIGPFIPHHDTPFAEQKQGSLTMTLKLLAIIRLMLPSVLLPATTALGTIHPSGRELGIQAGANVVMPNLSPPGVRKKYSLYDNKLCTGSESAQAKEELAKRMEQIGYHLAVGRGDYYLPTNHKERN